MLKCSSPAWNVFVSSAKCHKTRSLLAINMYIWRWVAETIWLLEMYTFVCSVISYLKVIQAFPDQRGNESTQIIIIEWHLAKFGSVGPEQHKMKLVWPNSSTLVHPLVDVATSTKQCANAEVLLHNKSINWYLVTSRWQKGMLNVELLLYDRSTNWYWTTSHRCWNGPVLNRMQTIGRKSCTEFLIVQQVVIKKYCDTP